MYLDNKMADLDKGEEARRWQNWLASTGTPHFLPSNHVENYKSYVIQIYLSFPAKERPGVSFLCQKF